VTSFFSLTPVEIPSLLPTSPVPPRRLRDLVTYPRLNRQLASPSPQVELFPLLRDQENLPHNFPLPHPPPHKFLHLLLIHQPVPRGTWLPPSSSPTPPNRPPLNFLTMLQDVPAFLVPFFTSLLFFFFTSSVFFFLQTSPNFAGRSGPSTSVHRLCFRSFRSPGPAGVGLFPNCAGPNPALECVLHLHDRLHASHFAPFSLKSFFAQV